MLSRFRIYWCTDIYSSAFHLALKACGSAASDCSGRLPGRAETKNRLWDCHQVAVFDGLKPRPPATTLGSFSFRSSFSPPFPSLAFSLPPSFSCSYDIFASYSHETFYFSWGTYLWFTYCHNVLSISGRMKRVSACYLSRRDYSFTLNKCT